MTGLVVVGGGQAGVALLRKWRQLGGVGKATLIAEEQFLPYERPPLSKAILMGSKAPTDLLLMPQDFYQQHNIDVICGAKATKIESHRQRIFYDVGENNLHELPYHELVLATGAQPRHLPLTMFHDHAGMMVTQEPTAAQGLHYLRSLTDALALQKKLICGKKLVIIGGGYIGLEVAAVARKLGLNVTLIEAAPRILQRVSAPETAQYLANYHQTQGVDLRQGISVAAIGLDQAQHIASITLADGSTLMCDEIVVGIGVVPNMGLAAAAQLETKDGIITNPFGQTSDDHIWAIGDCAAFPYQGQNTRLESVGHAIDMAELVAKNLLREPSTRLAYQPQPWFWSDQNDCHVQIAGLNRGYQKLIVRHGERGISHWYYDAANQLLAVDAINDSRAYMVAKKLLAAGRNLAPELAADAAYDVKDALK